MSCHGAELREGELGGPHYLGQHQASLGPTRVVTPPAPPPTAESKAKQKHNNTHIASGILA